MSTGHHPVPLEQRLAILEEQAVKHDHILFGNGRPGLLQDVAEIRASVVFFKTTAEQLQKDATTQRQDQDKFNRKLEIFVNRVETSVTRIETNGNSAFTRLKKAEALLLPILDWKKNILLRLATIGATATVIFGVLWAVFEHWDKFRLLFQ